MTGTLITPTVKSELNPLAFQGIMAYTCYAQIIDMLRRKFGDEYVLLFAQPIENTGNGIIDWYTPVQGTPQKLESLAEANNQAITAKIKAMADEIEFYADELISSQEAQKVTRGHILKLALSCPDYSYVYVVGQQPVFVAWGFGPGTPGVEPKKISRIAVATKAFAKPARMAAPRKPWSFAWLWWLLPFFAALLLLLILFTSFGNLRAISGYPLFHLPALPLHDADHDRSSEIAALEEEISVLLNKLDDHAAICSPRQAPEKPSPLAQQQQEELLVIPPEADDPSFLEGKWLCDTGLVSTSTGEPISLAFSFDKNGKGNAITYERNDRCTGSAIAEVTNGELRISLGESICKKDNHRYAPVEIICSNANGSTTECNGKHANGHTWVAPFKRVR